MISQAIHFKQVMEKALLTLENKTPPHSAKFILPQHNFSLHKHLLRPSLFPRRFYSLTNFIIPSLYTETSRSDSVFLISQPRGDCTRRTVWVVLKARTHPVIGTAPSTPTSTPYTSSPRAWAIPPHLRTPRTPHSPIPSWRSPGTPPSWCITVSRLFSFK